MENKHRKLDNPDRSLTPAIRQPPTVDTLQRGVQWIGGAVDWGSII